MFSRKDNTRQAAQRQENPRSASYIKPVVEKKASTTIKESLVNK